MQLSYERHPPTFRVSWSPTWAQSFRATEYARYRFEQVPRRPGPGCLDFTSLAHFSPSLPPHTRHTNQHSMFVSLLTQLTIMLASLLCKIPSWGTSTTATMTAPTIRLGTWNLRYDAFPDSIPVSESLTSLPDPHIPPHRMLHGEQPWSARRVRVAQRLQVSHVDLLGVYQKREGSRHPACA
jgi:hypothetical protein